MKFRLGLALCLTLLCSLAWAQPKLDLAALQNYFEAGKRMDSVAKKFPAMNGNSGEFLLGGDNQVFINRIKSAGALNEVNAEIKKSGYKSVDEYLDMTKRIMSALFAVQLEQSPEYSSPEKMRKMAADQKKQLEANGIPPAKVAQMTASVNEQLQQLEKIVAFAKKAQPDDVAAVRKNLEYVTKMIDSGAK